MLTLKQKLKSKIVKAKTHWANKAATSWKLWSGILLFTIFLAKTHITVLCVCTSDLQNFVNNVNDSIIDNCNALDCNDFVLPVCTFNDQSPYITKNWVYCQLTSLDLSKGIGSDTIPNCVYKAAAGYC